MSLIMLDFLKRRASFATKSLENRHGISLDLSYITDQLLCCSFPTSRLPSRYYRNDIEDLVKYLNLEHEGHWKIFSLRAKHADEYDVDTHYLQGKIVNYPWTDHEGPSFTYLIATLDSIDDYIKEDHGNIAVVHCRMGKGRSGLIAATYLMYKKGMSKEESENLFTEKRMTAGFGDGISNKSQMKYSEYMRIYCQLGKIYEKVSIPNIKIRLYGARFSCDDTHIEFLISGHGFNENVIDPENMRPYSNEDENGVIETVIPNSEQYTDIKISLSKTNVLNFKVSTVFLWFNIFFEKKVAKAGISHFSWEDFDGLKGTGKRGLRLFDQIDLHL